MLGARECGVEPLGHVPQALGRDLALCLGGPGDVAQAAFHPIRGLARELDDPVEASDSAWRTNCSIDFSSSRDSRSADFSRDSLICASNRRSASSEGGRPRGRVPCRAGRAGGALPRHARRRPGRGLRPPPGRYGRGLALAGAQALVDLVEGAAPLGGMRLDLVATLLDELGHEPLELGPELRHCLSLLLARHREPLRVGVQASVVRVERLLLASAQLGQLGLQLPLAAVEVRRPGHELGLEASLRPGDRVRQLDTRLLGLTRDCVAALLGQSALLLAQRVAGLRPLASQHPLELGHSLLRVPVEIGVEPRPCLFFHPLEVPDPVKTASQDVQRRLAEAATMIPPTATSRISVSSVPSAISRPATAALASATSASTTADPSKRRAGTRVNETATSDTATTARAATNAISRASAIPES